MLAPRLRALLRHPLRGRVTRFAISSAVAAATSAIVFPILYVLGASTTACTIIAFFAGLVAGWSLEDGLVAPLQGPISTGLLGGADLSWFAGIVVAGGLYLALGRRVTAPAVVASSAGS